MGVRVVVAGMVVFGDLGRRVAAVGDFTFGTLELDGRVIDAELLAQGPVYLLQDAGALGGRDVVDGDVSRTSMRLRSQTPDVKIMDILNPFDGLQRNTDLRQGAAAGSALEKNIQRLPHNRQ